MDTNREDLRFMIHDLRFLVVGILVALAPRLLAAGADPNRLSPITSHNSSPAAAGRKQALETRGPLARELWTSRIAAPESGADAEASLALQRLIRQVRRLTENNKTAAPGTAATAAPPAPAESSKTADPRIEAVAPVPPEPVPATMPETAPASKTPQTLDDLRRSAGRVRDPLEVAELLFLSGRPAAAAPFYEEALRRTGAAAAASDRAWILFQLGNSLREADAAKAQEAYTKLIAEYPDSPWTEMARASGRLLTWYQSARPDQWVAQSKP